LAGISVRDLRTPARLSSAAVATLAVAVGFVSAVSAATPLSTIVLRPAQVGFGYRLEMRSDSHCVARCVTLDLCGFTYSSEQLRTARLQVDYDRNQHAPGLSNEVVSYQRGGASQAMREVDYAVANCPKGPARSTVQGVPPLTYRLKRLRAPRLLPGYIALQERVTGKVGKRTITQTTLSIYQSHGNVLSAIYTTAPKGVTFATQAKFAFRVAQASATNLKR
jgi:hypothetical protein